MIKPVGKGKYQVFSHKTRKPLSRVLSKAGALRRLRQIRYYKNNPR